MKKIKFGLPFVLVASSLFAVSSQAAETNITVTATVDPTLSLTQADGTAIPKSLEMTYIPGKGLSDYTLPTKLFTNDTTKNILMRLSSTPSLVNAVNSSQTVPLTVSFGGNALSAANDMTINASNIVWDTNGGSPSTDLTIHQTTQAPLSAAGQYSGTVGIVITQSAAANP
ncbi:CS1 type fimbrial major subunit [Pseudomonas kitaguniensis]|uniref:CS1 type fimbrial major subunit n=1 Tax=Pseudomonas kitaguniensis TaxID=2607908 RepID=UPI003D07870A